MAGMASGHRETSWSLIIAPSARILPHYYNCSTKMLWTGFQYTPPTMLPRVGSAIRSGWKKRRTDAEDHSDLLRAHLHPFHQGPNNVAAGLKNGAGQPPAGFCGKKLPLSLNEGQVLPYF